MYGKQFRALRLSKNIRINELASSDISSSSISRFEKETQDIGINHLATLLLKMDVSLREWIDSIDTQDSKSDEFKNGLMSHYLNKDTNSLESTYDYLINRYQQKHDDETFDKLVVTANLYTDLSGKRLLSKPMLHKLYDYLISIEFWSAHDINLFGDTTALLTDSQLFVLEKDLVKQLPRLMQLDFSLYTDSWNSILNCYLTLIERDQSMALEIKKAIVNIDISMLLTQVRVRRYFLNQLLDYMSTADLTSKLYIETNIVKVISFLDDIGSQTTANQYLTLFEQHRID